jgi:rhodanese-related sulfurtransferase
MDQLSTLPVDKEIVAYCRGPYCVFADEAVALLRARGYRARRLEYGVADWRALGLPVEVKTDTNRPAQRSGHTSRARHDRA